MLFGHQKVKYGSTSWVADGVFMPSQNGKMDVDDRSMDYFKGLCAQTEGCNDFQVFAYLRTANGPKNSHKFEWIDFASLSAAQAACEVNLLGVYSPKLSVWDW